MSRYIKLKQVFYAISYMVLFLFAIRFLNKNNTFIVLYSVLGFILSYIHKKFTITRECIFLLLYGAFYYYTKVHWGSQNNFTAMITSAFGAPMMYLMGQQFMRYSEEKELYYKKICWILAIGMFLFAILSYAKNGVIYSYEYGEDLRQVPDLWVGYSSLWQATNINGYCVFAVVVSIVAILQKARGIKLIASVMLLVSSIYLSLITAARTNLFLVVLVVGIYLLLSIALKKNYRYMTRMNALNRFIVLVIGFLLVQVIVLNLDTILYRLPLEAFLERTSNHQLSVSDDGRWGMWASVVNDIPTHLFGNITSVSLAHNIYLDVARESGVIPLILLIIFTGMVMITACKFIWDERYSINVRMMNSVLLFSLWASFLIEPVMTAKPFVFIAFCMVCGMQKELVMSD